MCPFYSKDDRISHDYIDFSISPPLFFGGILDIDLKKYPLIAQSAALCFEIAGLCKPGPYETLHTGDLVIMENAVRTLISLIDREFSVIPENNELLNESLAYIHAHFKENITVEQLASRAHLATNYFQKVFKQYTGITPYQYIKNYRFSAAIRMLANGASVGEAAEASGFSSIAAFSGAFHKSYGLYPSAFQEKTFYPDNRSRNMNSSSRLFYTSPAKSFHEALPLGNGSFGAVAYSGTDSDRYSLNLDTLWSGFPEGKRPNPAAYEAYQKTKEYALNGAYRKAYLAAADFLGNRSEVYLPLGNLLIHTSHAAVSSYVRALDLENALLESSYDCCGVTYTKTAFLSYPDRVFVLRFACDTKAALSFDVSLGSPLKSRVFTDGNDLILQGEAPGLSYETPENKCGYALAYSQEPDQKGVQFYARLRILTDGRFARPPGHAFGIGGFGSNISFGG